MSDEQATQLDMEEQLWIAENEDRIEEAENEEQ